MAPLRALGAHAADPTPALEAVGLVRAFGDVRALDHAEFALPVGGLTALAGAPGSGRSTLLRVLAALLRPDAGSAQVLGADTLTAPETVRARLGRVGPGEGTWPFLTVAESLGTVAAAHGLRGPVLTRRIGQLADRIGLGPLAGRRVASLTGGERHRLRLAQALVHSPRVLLVDEPAAPVAEDDAEALRLLLRELTREDVTVLAVAAEGTDLARAADRVLVMEAGRVVASRVPDGHRPVAWRIAAIDAARLQRVLDETGTPFTEVYTDADERRGHGVVDVEVADERDAAALLGLLTAREVAVVGFGPTRGVGAPAPSGSGEVR